MHNNFWFLTAVFAISFFGQEVHACDTTDYVIASDEDTDIESHSGYADDNDDTPYDNSYSKCWVITASNPEDVVKLQTVTFDTEYSSTCGYDYLKIYNSGSASGDYVKKCGFSGSFTIYTSGQQMFLEFQTDSSNTYRGFKLTVSKVSSSNYDSSLWTNTYDSYLADYSDIASAIVITFWVIVGAIIGSIFLVIIIIIVIVLVVVCCIMKSSSGSSRGHVNRVGGTTVVQQGQVSYSNTRPGGAVVMQTGYGQPQQNGYNQQGYSNQAFIPNQGGNVMTVQQQQQQGGAGYGVQSAPQGQYPPPAQQGQYPPPAPQGQYPPPAPQGQYPPPAQQTSSYDDPNMVPPPVTYNDPSLPPKY